MQDPSYDEGLEAQRRQAGKEEKQTVYCFPASTFSLGTQSICTPAKLGKTVKANQPRFHGPCQRKTQEVTACMTVGTSMARRASRWPDLHIRAGSSTQDQLSSNRIGLCLHPKAKAQTVLILIHSTSTLSLLAVQTFHSCCCYPPETLTATLGIFT